MFDHVGMKLKALAKALCFCGIAASIAFGGVTIERGIYHGYVHGPLLLYGICIILGGSILSWLISLFIYGYGQLIENTDQLRKQPQYKTCTKECVDQKKYAKTDSTVKSESEKDDVVSGSEDDADSAAVAD